MKHLFSKLLMPVIAITVVSCSNDEWIEVQHGSLRDAEYSGKNLEVYLNGQPANVTSVIIDCEQDLEKTTVERTDSSVNINTYYYLTAIIKDFPKKEETLELHTIMDDYSTFEGEIQLHGKWHEYHAEFTDDPFIRPENQQLIIRFTEK